MTQTIVTKPVLQEKTCSVCPHFDNFHEPNGRGWCELFNDYAREHHEETQDCINSSESVISHDLEDNLALFPDVNFEELDAFDTEELEDELDKPHSEYEVGSIVKVIDPDEDYTEWALFEVIECLYNKNLYSSSETYLHQPQWYYRLSSHADGNTMPTDNFAKDNFLWVREDEICAFDMAHNVCTEDIF